jgi:putative transposase
MCLRFVFLLITRVSAWLRLSRREERWKTAGILILRHQLAILQRRQPRRPKLNWADRALLAALLSVIPKTGAPEAGAAGHPGHDRGLAP